MGSIGANFPSGGEWGLFNSLSSFGFRLLFRDCRGAATGSGTHHSLCKPPDGFVHRSPFFIRG